MTDNNYNPDDIEIPQIIPNEDLMKLKNIAPEYQQVLKDTYHLLSMVLNRPDLYENPVEYIEALEYTLQVLWGFPPDSKHHTYWLKIRGCTCAYHDNMELIGTGHRWYSTECPWHGNGENPEMINGVV